jgi:hypothetical protein
LREDDKKFGYQHYEFLAGCMMFFRQIEESKEDVMAYFAKKELQEGDR